VLLSVSVDLDEVRHYRAIHGLPASADDGAVFERAVPRLVDWARQRGVPLTWFVVGRDVESPERAEAVARLARAGDELGCHSYSHHYDLIQRPINELQREVLRGVDALRRAAGVTPTGFRAPGYVVSDTLLDVLRECELAYDSSIFPCPSYYALKVAAIARMKARGLESRSLVDAPDVLRAPSVPYRVGRPYWYRGTGILELPIQVTRRARLPFIGTSLTLAGATGARLLASRVAGEAFVTLELHGIDVLDRHDGLEALSREQRDLRIAWPKKLDAIDAAVSLLRSKGYACVRMDEMAAKVRAAS
jgi:peptidoglycan/xylan/chitin deacetylase (PgdA/CDA1 family)